MYDIKIRYRTGNSFETYETEDNINLPVESLEIAKENLQRIKKHNEIYNKINGYQTNHENISFPDFYVKKYDAIILKINDSDTHTMVPFWVGHFEKILQADIIVISMDDEDAMSVSF